MHKLVAALLPAAAVLVGCSFTTSTVHGDGTTQSGADDTCVSVSEVDGTSACGPSVCSAATYCSDNVAGICENGCTSDSNCAAGQSCDLASSTTRDPESNAIVGTCRASCGHPATGGTGNDGGGSAACSDVHGVYDVILDTPSSSAACAKVVSEASCTLVQSGCSVTWSCTPNIGFGTSTVDASGNADFTASGPGGAEGTCTAVFGGGSFTWDCQFTSSGGVADCNGTGALQ